MVTTSWDRSAWVLDSSFWWGNILYLIDCVISSWFGTTYISDCASLLCLSLLSILVISLTVCVYPHIWVYKTQYLNDRVFNRPSTDIGPRTRTKMNKLQIWVWRTASQLQREPREAWWVVTKSTTTNTHSNKTTSTTTTTLSQGAAASLRQRTKFKYFYCA